MSMENVVFILSLPRSGSTLLQKLIMAHPDFSSVAEPWMLLPFVYALKQKGVRAEYGHQTCSIAMRRLVHELSASEDTYYGMIGKMASDIYAELAGDKKYFVDKTPRYYLIVSELKKIFPKAKFIILVRNPISVFASSLDNFKGNSLRRLDHQDLDFYEGPKRISEGFELLRHNALVVRYEDLTADPSRVAHEICEYCEVDFDSQMIAKALDQDLQSFDDVHGSKHLRNIEDRGMQWRNIIDSPIRLWRLKRYLKKYNYGYLALGGYGREELLRVVSNTDIKKYRPEEILFAVEEATVRIVKKIIKWPMMG